ncbi:MAG: hypothetical protein M0R38_00175 [Bacteroidia bacterium]|nr:hypothetical protein [Bacteroidia bacterium]
MKVFLLLLGSVLLVSCFQENHYYEPDLSAKAKIDSLQKVILELENTTSQIDTVYTTQPTQENQIKTDTQAKEKKKVLVNPKPQRKIEDDSSTVRYKDGKISVTYGKTRNNRQIIRIYDRQGVVIIQFENVRLSFQEITTLKFRKDNSVESAETDLNPGASLYWYETYYTFDVDNEPKTKKIQRMPIMSSGDMLQDLYLWSRKNRQWVKQEIVKEMDTPMN